jgi:hypothetical protein
VDEGEVDAGIPAKGLTDPMVQLDDATLCLPSGKILSHSSARQPRRQQQNPGPSTDSIGP